MIFNIECTHNQKIKNIYNTTFNWENCSIELSFNYDKDVCKVKINGKNYEQNNDRRLDVLIKGLSNSMAGLEFEECYEGEKFSVNTDYM